MQLRPLPVLSENEEILSRTTGSFFLPISRLKMTKQISNPDNSSSAFQPRRRRAGGIHRLCVENGEDCLGTGLIVEIQRRRCECSEQTATHDPKRVVYLEDDAAYDKAQFLIPHHYLDSVKSVLIPKGLVEDRVEKLAQDIRYAYEGKTVHLLCVLKGGSAFFHALVEKLRLFHKYNKCDYVPFTFDFIRVKSYEGTKSTGNVQVSGADLAKFKGKDLLLVEDIIDTGKTMAKLVPMLKEYEPASVRVASLLEKRNPESCGFQADFVGFNIPDQFVIGNCLDYNEIFRDLDHICIINEAGIAKYASSS
ncbi:Phosphoribosyl transferase domain [Phytophthora infestans]|uniref:hypoxanthine phosphoribosyltransferase n=1 Tax=Phytophthora infestans TaxID=4787 RepID=A0A833T8G6_PHYIN|nr:Phosphoribosyl transferase domain [Phytophthora infestans]